MIIANATRYGLDKKLYKLQEYLDSKMPTASIYAVLDENDKKEGKILEWTPLEKEVFVDDREMMVLGFRILNKSIQHFNGKATLDCICTLKTDNRELIEGAVYNHLINSGLIDSVGTDIKLGRENVFTGLYSDGMKYRDIQKFHIFAYTIIMPYAFNICP